MIIFYFNKLRLEVTVCGKVIEFASRTGRVLTVVQCIQIQISTMENLKSEVFSKESTNTFNNEQLRDLQKETEIGKGLYITVLQLESTKSIHDVISS